jgi:hypothetical protein
MTPIFAALLFAALTAGPAWSQECGPACPACSGKTTGDLVSPTTIVTSWLHIPDGEEETSVFKIRAGLFPFLDVGIGYAVDSEETIWSLRAELISQDPGGWRPAVILGTGSVQTGGSDQSGYVQLAKTVELAAQRLEVSLAGGYATDLPDTREDWGLGTLSATLYEKASPFYTYDGVSSHAGLSVFPSDWLTLTGYWLELEEPAVALSLQWTLGASRPE